MPQSNIGRIFFTSSSSPAGPKQVGVGNFPASGVKNILVKNVGLTMFAVRGRANAAATSPDILLAPDHVGMVVLTGTSGQPAYVEFWKYFDPYYINMHNTSAPVDERPGVAEIEAIQG